MMGMENTCIGDFEHGIEPEHWQPYEEPVAQSRGLAFLRQDVGHMRKIREHDAREARYKAALERAAQILIDGDAIEREVFARQILDLLASDGEGC